MDAVSTPPAWARALVLAALLLRPVAAWAETPVAGQRIASITIGVYNVFDTTAPPENHRLYRMANGIHRNTSPQVIQRELLFAVGEPYDPSLVQETERNLRRLPFIRRAECIAALNSLGKVDILVRAYDAWTLEVVSSYKRAGGHAEWRAGLADRNLLGRGKTLSAAYSRGDSASFVSFAWRDPYLLGRKLNYSMAAVTSPGGQRYTAGLSRPFYASLVRTALGAWGRYERSNVATFASGVAVGTVRKLTQEFALDYGLALGTSTSRNRHLTAGFVQHRVAFAAIRGTATGPMPRSEQLGFFRLGAEWEALDFIEARHIRKFSHVEDINLGLRVFAGVAWAPRLPVLSSASSQFLPTLALRKGFVWAGNHILLLHGSYRAGYSDGGNSNRLTAMDVAYFMRGLPRQTLAVHAAFDHGGRLDPASPLTLGENNGLRGYGRHQFAGSDRVLFNLEDRIFIRDEIASLLDVGVVAFYDAGFAWPDGAPVRIADLKSSVGLGLRLAPSRSGNNSPVRIDCAYALNGGPDKSRWSLSILGGLGFGADAD